MIIIIILSVKIRKIINNNDIKLHNSKNNEYYEI